MRRAYLSHRERFGVLERCNFACFYCGLPARQGVVQLQVEHVIPVSQGGSNDPWNLVAACEPCNSGKAAFAPTEEVVAAATALYMSWGGRNPRVLMCADCARPWMPDLDDLEPMDNCWACVRVWCDGYYHDRTSKGA